ncbi:cation transporter [hydrocarbon metagenome]|uniref:Cation transporter n=1 Tax=hydrocarbon metagenome TaxID=938273 RepID=A0A0W8E6G8_9ZZZZ
MITGLFAILLAVLILPFLFHKVEENLEAFLFFMGLIACIVSGHLNSHLLMESLREPIPIALAVLFAGALFFIFRERFTVIMDRLFQQASLPLVVFVIIVVLGIFSSVITAIVAAIILVELIVLLPLSRRQKIVVCVVACYSIGFGAALTPIGEPLATIAISKLNQDFFYLLNLLGKYIIPSVLAMGIIGALYTWNVSRSNQESDVSEEVALTEETFEDVGQEDRWRNVIIRALKVYLFVMALVFLGEGFQPLIDKFILGLDYRILYWANMVSAVLDNATLTAAEISPQMGLLQIEAILMGLLISGGMLIPGNIPNIISASKLKISMTEWAKIGTPMGLVIMAFFYFILF